MAPAPVAIQVALLRGINVGGRRNVSMEALRALVESAGCADVTTYIASGNVLFRSAPTAPGALARTLEHRISQELDLNVAVLIRMAEELTSLVAGNPFVDADLATLHVTFLAETATTDHLDAIDAERYLPEAFSPVGRDLVVHCPNGYGRTKLINAFFERALGMKATTRNWRTVQKLAELARETAARIDMSG
jgi:uncharacterized protein (DUF1697 family)